VGSLIAKRLVNSNAVGKIENAERLVREIFLREFAKSSLFSYHFTGAKTGAPLSFTWNTTNFAGSVLLAFRLTT
jgi:hypothetical protein